MNIEWWFRWVDSSNLGPRTIVKSKLAINTNTVGNIKNPGKSKKR